jgi:hypothetical protein
MFSFALHGIALILQVLLQKNHSALVERGRQVSAGTGGKSKVLGGLLTKPLSKFSTVSVISDALFNVR